MRIAVIAILMAVVALGRTAGAEGLIQRLPEDGTWLRYRLSIIQTEGTKTGRIDGSLTIRFVGRPIIAGTAHRWMEWSFALQDKNERRTAIERFLIPEHGFRAGVNPFSELRQVWTVGDEEPEAGRLDDYRSPDLDNAENGWLVRLLEPLAEPVVLEQTRSVPHAGGRWECRGLRTDLMRRPQNTSREAEADAFPLEWFGHFTLWTHRDVPTGVAAAELEFAETFADGVHRTQFVLLLEEIGSGATAQLPVELPVGDGTAP